MGEAVIENEFGKKEYHGQKVATTPELANIFGISDRALRENYSRNRKRFTENTDYFILLESELDKFRAKYKVDFPENRKKYFLWTKRGAMIHLELLKDENLIQISACSLNKYFSIRRTTVEKELKPSTDVTSQLKEFKQDVAEMKKASLETLDIVKKLEAKLDADITKDCLKASDIAHKLCLYSRGGLPHSSLIASIARKLGMNIEHKNYYQDEDIVITNDGIKDINHWQVYYKPDGVNKIFFWFENNKDITKYENLYKKDTRKARKGDIREYGYKINGIKYKLKIE